MLLRLDRTPTEIGTDVVVDCDGLVLNGAGAAATFLEIPDEAPQFTSPLFVVYPRDFDALLAAAVATDGGLGVDTSHSANEVGTGPSYHK
jgi:hypothetical protein